MIYVNVTDKAMSGWGQAPGRSYFCVACPDWPTAEDVMRRMETRPEMKRLAYADNPRRGGPGDHTSVIPAEQFTYRPVYNV